MSKLDKCSLSEKDAKKFLKILSGADGGCIYCVSKLYKFFIKEFPQYSSLANKHFEKEFDTKLDGAREK